MNSHLIEFIDSFHYFKKDFAINKQKGVKIFFVHLECFCTSNTVQIFECYLPFNFFYENTKKPYFTISNTVVFLFELYPNGF